jgi:predicted DNA binding protein
VSVLFCQSLIEGDPVTPGELHEDGAGPSTSPMTLGPRRAGSSRVSHDSNAEARSPAHAPSRRNRIIIMKLEARLPAKSWYTGFSKRHPEILLEVTNSQPVGESNTLAEVEIYGPAVDWTGEIARFPDVIEVERLSEGPNLGRYRVRYRTSQIVQLTSELEVMIRYPRTVQNGMLTCETIARLSHLRRLVAALSTLGYEPRIASLRRDSLRSVRFALTLSQRALFRQALALGYFEVPRRISLSRLAEKVSRSKSSVSEMLAVVERKLVHYANVAGV